MSDNRLCFFCGGHQDLLALFPMGGEYTGANTPGCDLCRSMITTAEVAIFECTEQNPDCGNPEVQPGVWFTGRWTTVPKTYLKSMYAEEVAAKVAQAGAGTLNQFRYRSHRLDVYRREVLQ